MTTNTDLHVAMPELPENIREGAPYDDPRFADLCREYQIWGTPQSALCAVFWRAAIQQAAGAVPEGLADLLQSCRGSVKNDLVQYQQILIRGPESRSHFARASIETEIARLQEIVDSIDAFAASPAPPKQQPALGRGDGGGVPLSEAKLGELYRAALDHWNDDLINVTFYFARAIEAAHGIGAAPTGQINPDSAGQGMEGGV